MKRRTFAAAASGTLAGLAGCLSDGGGSNDAETTAEGEETTTGSGETTTESEATSSGGETTGDGAGDLTAETDGYPDEVESKPDDREIDTSDLATVEEGGVEVPLLPVDDAHVWWAYERARFADARGPDQWENSRIVGAVSSPAATDMRGDDDPTQAWAKDDRIVCYCGCPHHLSSIRASQLIEAGYENVYVIDEGFYEWESRGYPVTGGSGGLERFVVRGRLDGSFAGENAWISPVDSEQLESTNVADDGSFELHCKFVDVTADSRLRLETPAWTTTGTVRELTSGVVRGD